MDWFDAHRGIADLKTCDNLDWFEADARRYGYAHQLAFCAYDLLRYFTFEYLQKVFVEIVCLNQERQEKEHDS